MVVNSWRCTSKAFSTLERTKARPRRLCKAARTACNDLIWDLRVLFRRKQV